MEMKLVHVMSDDMCTLQHTGLRPVGMGKHTGSTSQWIEAG